MPSVGPQLPPSLTEKRKRKDEDDEASTSSQSSNSPGPQPANVPADKSPKRQRVIGPTLPPAPLDERPSSPPPTNHKNNETNSSSSSDDDDDDDDFGPALPTAAELTSHQTSTSRASDIHPTGPDSTPTRRDEWMTIAPTNGDWSSRVDPTKLKNRKFNTSKGIKGAPSKPSGGAASGNDAWYETPEQKQARLQREVLGIKDSSSTTATSAGSRQETQEERDTARRMKEYSAARGPSLYEAHQQKSSVPGGGEEREREKDDDPSARAFDREKDIGGGMQINSTKRRDMVKKAGGFSDRFGKASYL